MNRIVTMSTRGRKAILLHWSPSTYEFATHSGVLHTMTSPCTGKIRQKTEGVSKFVPRSKFLSSALSPSP
jgi:hypothetical protein